MDPVLRPFSGPEEPLVGATKGVKLTAAGESAHHMLRFLLSSQRWEPGLRQLLNLCVLVVTLGVSMASAGRLSYLSQVVTAPHHDRQAKPNTRRCIPVQYPPVSLLPVLFLLVSKSDDNSRACAQ